MISVIIEHIIYIVYESKTTSEYFSCCPYHCNTKKFNDIHEDLLQPLSTEIESPYISNILI